MSGSGISLAELDRKCLNFLQRLDFVSLVWEDNDGITAYSQSGEPWGVSEFVMGSSSRKIWEALEEVFEKSKLSTYRFPS